MIYLISCETAENGGGVYACFLTENGVLQKTEYFPCDRPMYAVKCKQGVCVLLRQPFQDNDFSGYFYLDENLQKATEIKSTKGIVACHLCVDDNDVYIVNYLSGNIVKNGETTRQRSGKGSNTLRQTEPHTHFVGQTPDGRLAVCDLGTDTLAIYDKCLNIVSESKVPSGYGIRHLVFSKSWKNIYAVNELVPSVSIFTYDNGETRLINTTEIKCENKNANGAAIRLSENGKFLYVSLREENKICVFNINREKLTLLQTVACGVDGPRDFDIYKNYFIVLGEKSGSVMVYKIKDGLINEKVFEMPIRNALCIIK